MHLCLMSETESVHGSNTSAQIHSVKRQAFALTDALIELGVSVVVLRVMLCLYLNVETTSKNLQASCELRQPEISTAIKQLTDLSLVKTRRSGSGGRGRPSHIYNLCMPINSCVEVLLADVEQRIQAMKDGVVKVERLTRGL